MLKVAVVGAGLAGATIARLHADRHDTVQVFESDYRVGGNVRTSINQYGTTIHEHGAHIFHTNNDEVWQFANRFTEFEKYRHTVVAFASIDKSRVPLPFNLATFDTVFGHATLREHRATIQAEVEAARRDIGVVPANLEEHCLVSIGKTLYNLLVKHYTERQWSRACTDLSASTIKRIPLRWTYDNSYFHNAKYEGIPVDGYSAMIDRMFDGISIMSNVTVDAAMLQGLSSRYDLVYVTCSLDELFLYQHGQLEYRSLEFDKQFHALDDNVSRQGIPVVNYTARDFSYTRSIEHCMFRPNEPLPTISEIWYEKPIEWQPGLTRYYPIGTIENLTLHNHLTAKLKKDYSNVIPIGRLAKYRYFDMDAVIADTLETFKETVYKS